MKEQMFYNQGQQEFENQNDNIARVSLMRWRSKGETQKEVTSFKEKSTTYQDVQLHKISKPCFLMNHWLTKQLNRWNNLECNLWDIKCREVQALILTDHRYKSKQLTYCESISKWPTDLSCQPKQLTCTSPLFTEPCLGEINHPPPHNTDYQYKEHHTLCLKDPPQQLHLYLPLIKGIKRFQLWESWYRTGKILCV